MAFNGSGLFVRIYNWATESGSPPIAISKLDTQEEDIATALSTCITKDGQTTITAAIPFNDKRITGLGAPTTSGDAVNTVFGTFTGTLTGFASNPTGTVTYKIIGNVVTLHITASIIGTSNATSLSMTGLPAAVRPAAAKQGATFCYDDGNLCLSRFDVGTGGSISFSLLAVSASLVTSPGGNNFTSSGTKGITSDWTITYPLS
jgi:hypothetical protein